MFLFWRPIPALVWEVEGAAAAILWALFALGCSDEARALCDPYLDPADASYVLDDPLCAVVIIDHLLLGRPRR